MAERPRPRTTTSSGPRSPPHREYFGFLLAKRFNLEWYMEGCRSRTGKLRPPRHGLLAGVAEALETDGASAIHHFVDRAIAELMALCAPGHRWDEAARLRDLLKFEFFFPDRETHHAALCAELVRMDPDWETADGHDVLRGAGFRIAHRVLRSFLDAQLVVAERLAARDPSAPVVAKDLLDECGGVGRQMLPQGRLHGPESLSRELFGSALKLAANQDLVDARADQQGDDLAVRRQAFAAQLRDVVRKVIEIDEIDAATRREAAGVEP